MTLPSGLVTGKCAKLPTDLKVQPANNAAERSGLELAFFRLWRATYPTRLEPTRQYRFDPRRKWRIDFAWPELKLAVELDGGVHCIKAKQHRDAEKHNALQTAGWTLLRYTAHDLKTRPVQCVQEVAMTITMLECNAKGT